MELSRVTREMLSMLPSWMKMRDKNSIGAQFLDVPGTEIEYIVNAIDEYLSDLYIGTVDVSQIDIIYKVEIPKVLLSADAPVIYGYIKSEDQGTYHEYLVEGCKYPSEFYAMDAHRYLIDMNSGICYFRKKYDYVIINGAFYSNIMLHHVWNAFDELGLLVGCPRLFGETNNEYRQRILDVFRRPGSSNKQGLVNALSRELGIEEEQVEVNALSDIAFKGTLLNEDGSPSQKMIAYANKVNEVMANTWGSATWDRCYWASIDQSNVGIDYLPHIWDAPMDGWATEDFQSGIGDGEDLLVEPPRREHDVQPFEYHVGLAGVELKEKDVYPPHEFKYKIVAKGTVMSESVVPEEYYYTIVASKKIPLIFKVKARKEFEQKSTHTFNDTPVHSYSDYSSLPESDKKNSYFVSDATRLEIVSGHSVPNPAQRYIEIEVDLYSNENGTQTPTVHDITLTWTDPDGTDKSLKIDTQSGVTQDGNDYIVGFTANTWNTPDTPIRVENDNYNTEFSESGSMSLGKGEFSKIVDTEGDWNRSTNMTNIIVTSSGDIKLSL